MYGPAAAAEGPNFSEWSRTCAPVVNGLAAAVGADFGELTRTCAPVVNGLAAAVGADFEPPIPPLATPVLATTSAIIETTRAGDGRRSSRRLSEFLDT